MSSLTRARERSEAMIAAARKSIPPSVAPSMFNSGYGGVGDYQNQEKTRRQYNLNTGWTFAAIRPVSVRVAKQPFRMGRKVKDNGKNFIKSRLPEYVKSQLSEETTLEMVESHEFLRVLADPNELMTEWCLKFVTAASTQLTGRAFWWMVPTKRKDSANRIDIWPIPSHWIKPNFDSAGTRTGWVITPPGKTQGEVVSNDEIAYFYYPDAMNPFESRGPMDAARPAAETSEMIRTAQRSTFDNVAMPTTAFITGMVPGDDGKMQRPELTRDQREQIEMSLRQLYRGATKWGRMIILDRVIEDVKQIMQKPAEMDFQQSGEMTKQEIMQIFGVNEIVAGAVQNANRAAATVATEGFLDNVVNPLLTLMSQVINQWVMPFFAGKNETVLVWIEEAKALDQDGKREDLKFLANIGGLMIDEARAQYGFPPLPFDKGQVTVMPAMLITESMEEEDDTRPTGEGMNSANDPQQNGGSQVPVNGNNGNGKFHNRILFEDSYASY